jgi:RHS repeat-associated protein
MRLALVVFVVFLAAAPAFAAGPTYVGELKPDLATNHPFTEDPLVPRVTRVRRVHLTELRAAVNAVRQQAGLAGYAFTDPSPLRIRAIHVLELRSAIEAAMAALRRPAPVWTEPVVPRGRIKARHFQEIRNVARWEASGTITSNSVWSAENSPYVLSGTVTVPNGVTLTITPGTVVKFAARAALEVAGGGTLQANGTAGRPIVFTSIKDDSAGGDTNRDGTSTSPAAGDWVMLSIGTSTQRAFGSMTHARISYGTQVRVRNSSPALSYVTSSHMSGYGLLLQAPPAGAYTIDHLTLTDNDFNLSLVSVPSTTTIRDSIIRRGVSLGVLAFENTAARLENNAIELNADLAILTDGTSPIVLRYNSIANNRGAYGDSRAIQTDCCATVDARFNWWGSTTGPNVVDQQNSGGGGDIDSRVLYDDWLGEGWDGSFRMGDHPWTLKAGVGVDVATGNFFLSENDLAIDTIGFPLEISRTYNNKIASSTSSEIGEGWAWNYGTQIRNSDSPYGVVWLRDDGIETYFKRNPDNTFSSEEGMFEKLTWEPSTNTYRLRLKDQSVLVFDASGRLSQQIDANGNQTVITRDGSGRVTKVTEPLGRAFTFTYAGQYISQVTDPIGRTIEYQRNDGRLTAVLEYESSASTYAASSYGYGGGGVWEMTHYADADGNVLDQSYEPGSRRVSWQQYNNLGVVTFSYDPGNHLTTVNDRRDLDHDFYYTASNKVSLYQRQRPWGSFDGESEWNYVGYLTSAKHDRDGSTTTVYDWLTGNPISVTEPGGRTTTYTYDRFNNVTSRRDMLGRTTTFAYDERQNLIRETNANDETTQHGYFPNGLRTVTIDALGRTTTYTYDANGYPLTVTNPLGETTTYQYDDAGRKIAETDPLGNKTTYGHNGRDQVTEIVDPLGNRTTYGYDSHGRRISTTDARDNTTSYSYNDYNLLSKTTDAYEGTVELFYDDETGNLTSIIDPNGNETFFGYDDYDRKVIEIDALNRIWEFEYVGRNRLSRVIDGRGRSTWRDYDEFNQLSQITYPNGATVTFSYDAVGNRTSMSDWTGTTNWVYDSLNRVINVDEGFPDTAYGYDAAGNLSWIRTESGKPVTYTYDAADRLKTVADWSGRTTTYTYDAAGRMIRCAYPNGVLGDRAYDAAGRLLAVTYLRNNAILRSRTYAYDRNGQRTSETDESNKTTSYSYDALNRLYWTSHSDGHGVLYGFYPSGDRAARTFYSNGVPSPTTRYYYDAANQALNDDRGDAYYNLNGQLTRSGRLALYWDPQDRLQSIEHSGREVSWLYDGEGRRVQQWVNGINSSYVIDSASRLSRVLVETTNGVRKHHVYGLDLLYTVENDVPHYVHADALGSVILGTNSLGQRETLVSYDPFGAVGARSYSQHWPTHLFAGEQTDMLAGNDEPTLVYLRARYYDPLTGRFLSRDPVPGDPMDTQARNPYLYARHNPVNLTDPSGECPWCIAGIGAAVGVIQQGISDYVTRQPFRLVNYGAAAIGGATSALTLMATRNRYAAEAVGGLFRGTFKEAFAPRTEPRSFFTSLGNVAYETVGGLPFVGFPVPRIGRITTGRNSYSAIANQIDTKLWNRTISRVAPQTVLKVLTGRVVESFPSTVFESWLRPPHFR